jgi:UDP-glucose 4-epimerase
MKGIKRKLHYLVTGGSGFVGSHLVDALLARGDFVTVLDDLSTGREINLAQHRTSTRFELINGSILDLSLLYNLVKKSDFVFHLAAAVGVFNIIENPLKSLLTNIRGSENVLESCAKFKKAVLVTSTSEIYGKNTSDGLSEEDDRILGSPLKTRWSYSEAKAIEEVIAFSYWQEQGLPTRIVRLFNTVGPRQLGSYGMVLPRFVKSAIEDKPLIVYGDGKQTRCFIHIYDVVNALLKISDSEKTIGSVFNVGNNYEISILNLAKKVVELTESKSEIKFLEYENAYEIGFEDMQRRVPNVNKLTSLLDWNVTKSLEDMINDVALTMKNA